MNKSLACSVILYFPDSNVLYNIATYIQYVDFLFIVDNGGGQQISETLLEKYPNKIEIVINESNQGIAKSLNKVLQRCKGKFDLLMTMDQDSSFADDAMRRYRVGINQIDWNGVFGVCPEPKQKNKKECNNISSSNVTLRWCPVVRCITSGNIISIAKALSINGFDESLFIDEVDHEICFRASLQGWQHLKTTDVILWHCLGNTVEKRILGITIHIMGHSGVRKYYIARNRLTVWRRYHKTNELFFFRAYIVGMIWEFVCVCLFEQDKINKIKFFFEGLLDGFRSKMGKLSV